MEDDYSTAGTRRSAARDGDASSRGPTSRARADAAGSRRGGTDCGSRPSPSTTTPASPGTEFTSVTPRQLIWIDRQGRQTPLGAPLRGYAYPRISPDGRPIVVDVRDDEHGLWMWDVGAGTLTPFSIGRAGDIAPVWSHDGQWVLFSRGRGVAPGLFRRARNAHPSAAIALPAATNSLLMPTALMPDDRTVIVTASVASGFDLQAIDLESPAAPRALAAATFDELNGDVSPDGRWLAYQSRESGRFEVWVQQLSGSGSSRWRVTSSGASRPVWTTHGTELAYVSGDREIWAVPVESSGDRPAFGPAMRLFAADLFVDLAGRT